MNVRIERQQERRDKVRTLWSKGLTVGQIVERLGVVRQTVVSDLKNLGISQDARKSA